MSKEMTAEQIKNWRQILLMQIGIYATIMPEEEIIAFRDKFEKELQDHEQKIRPTVKNKKISKKITTNK